MKTIQILSGFWRESARGLRLFNFSAYVTVPILMFILHIRWWTFWVLVVTILFLAIIERYGYTPPVAILAIRAYLAGKLIKRRKSMFQKKLDC
ncbi:hypothetical protein CBP36_19910 (plasmid) [Acidovorax carolinensis]|uniref:Phosphoesterase n=1 Tax=Acidovorax carolinensis TaxID=553814 RepID=A0A240UIA1_9BURK|nr:IcmT/TraK family protein [Acidovorax carolinensis]ART57176.1 hypothetical protein CBP35_19880 [Acidovorax carolinensis]ART61234.1 hypothetical protein CBP36_19910 [Acidovorax carolinensis]